MNSLVRDCLNILWKMNLKKGLEVFGVSVFFTLIYHFLIRSELESLLLGLVYFVYVHKSYSFINPMKSTWDYVLSLPFNHTQRVLIGIGANLMKLMPFLPLLIYFSVLPFLGPTGMNSENDHVSFLVVISILIIIIALKTEKREKIPNYSFTHIPVRDDIIPLYFIEGVLWIVFLELMIFLGTFASLMLGGGKVIKFLIFVSLILFIFVSFVFYVLRKDSVLLDEWRRFKTQLYTPRYKQKRRFIFFGIAILCEMLLVAPILYQADTDQKRKILVESMFPVTNHLYTRIYPPTMADIIDDPFDHLKEEYLHHYKKMTDEQVRVVESKIEGGQNLLQYSLSSKKLLEAQVLLMKGFRLKLDPNSELRESVLATVGGRNSEFVHLFMDRVGNELNDEDLVGLYDYFLLNCNFEGMDQIRATNAFEKVNITTDNFVIILKEYLETDNLSCLISLRAALRDKEKLDHKFTIEMEIAELKKKIPSESAMRRFDLVMGL